MFHIRMSHYIISKATSSSALSYDLSIRGLSQFLLEWNIKLVL